jgi:hypothetical protein
VTRVTRLRGRAPCSSGHALNGCFKMERRRRIFNNRLSISRCYEVKTTRRRAAPARRGGGGGGGGGVGSAAPASCQGTGRSQTDAAALRQVLAGPTNVLNVPAGTLAVSWRWHVEFKGKGSACNLTRNCGQTVPDSGAPKREQETHRD